MSVKAKLKVKVKVTGKVKAKGKVIVKVRISNVNNCKFVCVLPPRGIEPTSIAIWHRYYPLYYICFKTNAEA